MSTYYRFRSAERLLGREASGDTSARQGELEELTIYFASPQELNDPLEGHRETYFEGDVIVWENLIKHYTLVLLSSTISYYADDQDSDTLRVNLKPEHCSADAQKVLELVLGTIFSNSAIARYINALGGSNKKISRLELSVHLSTLHQVILAYILDYLSEHLDIPEAEAYRGRLNNFILFISTRCSQISNEGPNPDIKFYKEMHSKINQQFLRGGISRTNSLGKGALDLFIKFPEKFSQQIDYLMYPRWYVACFMKSCSNPAIWASYGENHKGVCLIYESKINKKTDCLSFHNLPSNFVKAYNYGKPKDQVFLSTPIQLPLTKVNYKPTLLKSNFFTSIFTERKEWVLSYWHTSSAAETSKYANRPSSDLSKQLSDYKKQYELSITTKTTHWENEDESRVILNGYNWSPSERQLKFSFSELKGLVFGINTPDEIKIKIIKKIETHCIKHQRSDFKFYQAQFDDAYHEIEHKPLNHITFNFDGTLNLNPEIG